MRTKRLKSKNLIIFIFKKKKKKKKTQITLQFFRPQMSLRVTMQLRPHPQGP